MSTNAGVGGVQVSPDNGPQGDPGPPGPAGASGIQIWGNFSIGNDAGTHYLTPGYEDTTAQEVVIEFASPRDGTYRNMYLRQNQAPGAANPVNVSYRLRVNGVDTALQIDRLANAGIGTSSDLVHTVAVSAGDRIAMVAIKADVLGAGGAIAPIISVEFV